MSRIEELKAEAKKLMEEREKASQIINNINIRLAEISGGLKELEKFEKKETKADVSEDKPKEN